MKFKALALAFALTIFFGMFADAQLKFASTEAESAEGMFTNVTFPPGQTRGVEFNLSAVCKISTVGRYRVIAKKVMSDRMGGQFVGENLDHIKN